MPFYAVAYPIAAQVGSSRIVGTAIRGGEGWMDDDSRQLEEHKQHKQIQEHKQFIEAWVSRRHPTVTDITWKRETINYYTHTLSFNVGGDRYSIVFPSQHLEDKGTESQLEAILEGARPLRAGSPHK
jgi:hypothetical protein